MGRARRLLAFQLVLTSALSCLYALGCDAIDGGGDGTPSRCSGPYQGSELEGAWSFTARGQRHDCDDASFDGDLEVELAMPIAVTVAPRTGAADASTASDDYSFALSGSAPDGLALSGDSSGACVSLSLRESLSSDDEVVYELDGVITGQGLVEGDFVGRGPAGCRADGTFVIEAR